MSNVMATTIQFDLNQMFPSTDSAVTPLLWLMMATDDLRHLQKLCLILNPPQESSESDDLIFNGEAGHLHRLLCSHLHEAGTAIHNFEQEFPRKLETLLADDANANVALTHVHDAFDPKDRIHFGTPSCVRFANASAFITMAMIYERCWRSTG